MNGLPVDESVVAAERSVLGACLLSPDAVVEVARMLSAADFQEPRNSVVFDSITRLHSAGAPADVISVVDDLLRRGVLHQAGNAEYVHELTSVVPTASSAGYYAAIVQQASLGRELTAEVIRAQDAVVRGEAPSSVLASTITGLMGLRDRAGSGRVARSLGDVLAVPADVDRYDWVVPGLLERRDRCIITGGEGGGKALAIDTVIPTPNGWTMMGNIAVGDYVLGADGRPTMVVAATDVMMDRPCYTVEFSDGSSIVADADHQWLTSDYYERKRGRVPSVRTTRELAESVSARGGFCLNHSVAPTDPLVLPYRDLPLDPWVLGAWLGDGHTAGGRITIGDEDRDEMLSILSDAGWPANKQSGKYLYGIRGLKVVLRQLGVLGRKRIPSEYLRASVEQRLALLQGLMDTDGTVDPKAGVGRGSGSPRCEFSVTNEALALDVHELILSLGIVATFRADPAKLNGRVVGTRYRIAFRTDLPVFKLSRKAGRLGPLRSERSRRRFITGVHPVDSVPVRCIQVDNDHRMYLAGRSMIPTHNSTLLRQLAILTAAGLHPFLDERVEPARVLVIDAENSERQWRREVRVMADMAARFGVRDPRDGLAVDFNAHLNVTRAPDLGGVHRMIDEWKPDLVLIGPLYRIAPSMSNDEEAVPVLAALETIRDRDVAMLIEAHAPHADSRAGTRDLRPIGSSALLRWPEFGLGIAKPSRPGDPFSLVRWRGDRDGRAWPARLLSRRDVPVQRWPWAPTEEYVQAARFTPQTVDA